MVNKGEKPTETTLARGRILPAELHRVLHQAGADATFLFIRVVWRGEHDATMTDLEDLDPIEDAEKVFSVYGRFDFEDGSSLTLKLQDYRQPSFASATGQTARARLALIGQTWSQIPGRAKITRSWDFLPWVVAFGCVSGAAFYLVASGLFAALSWQELTVLGGALRTAALLITIALYLSVRRLTQHRWIAHLLTVGRKEPHRVDGWTIASSIGGVGALAVAVIAYLYPRQ